MVSPLELLKQNMKRRYRNGPDNIGRDLVAPCLKNSSLYRRGTGFFSSGALVAYAFAMDNLVSDKTKIEIICSPVVHDQELLRTLNNNLTAEQKKITLQRLTDKIVLEAVGYQMDNKRRDYKNNLLAYLIAKNILEIRFAVPINFSEVDFLSEPSLTNNLYHVKTGYFHLTDSSIVGFDGSFNESDAGHQYHVDQTQVWRSWEHNDSERLADIVEQVDSDWSGTNKFIQVFKISAETMQLVKSIATAQRPTRQDEKLPSHGPLEVSKPANDVNELRHYQEQALKQWKDADYHGILAMATGTGKTRTAIEAIVRFRKENNRGLVVITVPYIPLAIQWIDELGKKLISTIKVFDSKENWESRVQNLFASHSSSSAASIPTLPVLVCVNKTFKNTPFQKLIARLQGKSGARLLVVDECHHFNKSQQITKLPQSFQYRLGLSATPYESEEPKNLEKYFGETVYEFSISKAITEGYLSPYYYNPILIEFTENEAQKFVETAKKIQMKNISETDSEDSEVESNVGAYDELDRILETVVGKLTKLESVLKTIELKKFTLFYCGEGYIRFDDGERLRQVDSLTRLLDKLNWRVGRITSEESQSERQMTFDNLRQGNIDAIASIRVLDEGVDIPDCRQAFILASQRSERQGIQRRGRILRNSTGKTSASLFDFIIVGPKLSNSELEKLYSRELKRARLFAGDAINKSECLSILNGIA
jgi:superfamily II DNA or RNA helicase